MDKIERTGLPKHREARERHAYLLNVTNIDLNAGGGHAARTMILGDIIST